MKQHPNKLAIPIEKEIPNGNAILDGKPIEAGMFHLDLLPGITRQLVADC